MKGLIHSNIMVILNNSSLKRTIVCRLLRVEYFLPDDRLGRLPGFATFGTFTGFTTGYQVYADWNVYNVYNVYDWLRRVTRFTPITPFTTFTAFIAFTPIGTFTTSTTFTTGYDRGCWTVRFGKAVWDTHGVYSISSNCQRDIGTFAMS